MCQISRLIGGLNPARSLSVMLDVGTDNEQLLDDKLYVVRPLSLCVCEIVIELCIKGWKHKRVRGEEYDEFLDKSEIASSTRQEHY